MEVQESECPCVWRLGTLGRPVHLCFIPTKAFFHGVHIDVGIGFLQDRLQRVSVAAPVMVNLQCKSTSHPNVRGGQIIRKERRKMEKREGGG